MSWNFPHPPPPPPPGAGPHPGPPHPPPPPPPYSNSPFWDFINSFGPSNRSAGAGVDHADTDSPHGFTFGPGGFNAWSGRHGFQGSWGGPGRRGGRYGHGRCRHCPFDNEDDESSSSSSSGDEEMRDVNRPATMTPETESPPGQQGVTDEKRDSPATMRDENENGEVPDPPEEVPSSPPRGGRNGGRCGQGRHGHGPFWGRGGRHGGRHGPHRGHSHGRHHHHHHHPHHPRGPPPPPGGGPPPHPPFTFSFPFGGPPRGGNGGPGGGAFDFNAMMNAFADHPFARGLREHWAELQQHRQQRRDQAAAANNRGEQCAQAQDSHDDGSDTFVPPVDIFNTSNNWTLHVAVPGAKKEDVNVHWDADRSTLLISGLVYRPGDEEFLNTLVAAERRVGLFERRIQLPPAGISHNEDGEKEEVDADHITARMEDGILVVVVPKVEKGWTEVKKVDIE